MEQVAVIMGSTSDWETMKHSCEILEELGIPYIKKGCFGSSDTGLDVFLCRKCKRKKGLKVIIAGAGGAAHLPGMVAAKQRYP